jgi:hypothetical protein
LPIIAGDNMRFSFPERRIGVNTSEWKKCRNPRSMLPYLETNTSPRKRRLLAVAFCRRIASLMTEDRCQRLLSEAWRFGFTQEESDPVLPDFLERAVREAERCADGLGSMEELAVFNEVARTLARVQGDYYACYDPSWGPMDLDLFATCEASEAVYEATGDRISLMELAACVGRAVYRARNGEEQNEVDEAESVAQCDVIREIFPQPPRSASSHILKVSVTAGQLARVIYDEGIFDDLPILADAVEEAGAPEELVAHLRAPGPHFRGCWALDLCLGLS